MRTSVKALVILFGLVWLAIVATADESRTRIDSEQDEGYPIFRNLCDRAIISAAGQAAGASEYSLVADGNRTTGMETSALGESGMLMEIYGSPSWANAILITHTGELDVWIGVHDVYKEPAEVEFSVSTVPYVDSIMQTTLRFDDMRISTITVRPREKEESGSKEATTLYEVEAYYESLDADDGLKGAAAGEIGVEYVQYYKNKPCDASNITGTKNDARSFRDKLNDHLGWARQFTYGNSAAYETDFTSNNPSYADNVDFVFFSGHGDDGYVKFSHKNNGCYLDNTECQGAWGNQDMEWIYFSSCQTLRSSIWWDNWGTWHGCFNGLHQVLGWHSNMKDVNLGKHFGNYAAKKKWRIFTSFKSAARKSHGAGWGSKTRRIVVLAETENSMNDQLHGAGYVSPDYSNNGWYYYWWYQFSGTKALNDKYENNIVEVDRDNASLIKVREQNSPAIIVPDHLLTKQQEDSLPVYAVSLRTVDSAYVDNLADEFCANYGFFCTYQFIHDTAGAEYAVIDGPHELYVSEVTGGWEYSHTVIDAAPTTAPPFLPSPSITPALADGFWNTVGRLPLDAVSTGEPSYLTKGLRNADTGEEDPDSSWNLSITASHERWIGTYPIIGPGACLEVDFGDNNVLHSAYYGGWRDVNMTGKILPVSLGDALQSVASSGPEVAIGSMPLCDSFLVESAMLGYYEPDGDTAISELQPIWAVDGWCLIDDQFGIDTSFYQLWIPADYSAPHGMIDSPSQDTTIDPGTPVTLAGSATSGTPPYTYNWYSEIDDYLGSGANLLVPSLSDTGKTGLPPALHTVILEVVDANGATDYATVDIQVGQTCCVNRGNVDAVIGAGGPIDVADLSYLVDYLFRGGPPPPCTEEGNVDGVVGAGGPIDVADLSYLVDFLFRGGPAPPPCL